MKQYSAIVLFVFIACSLKYTGCKNSSTNPVLVEKKPVVDSSELPVWSDEFSGASLDISKWNYETGTGVNGDFGTGQVDRATNRTENVSIVDGIPGADGGCLAITTRKESYIDRSYTSGRINTKGKGAWGPGYKLEARIWPSDVRYKGQGFAFWMMPAEKPSGVGSLMWPQGGEIDIMEYVGSIPYHNLGSVHYAWNWNSNEYSAGNHAHEGSYYSYYSGDVPITTPEYGGYPVEEGDTNAGSGGFHVYGIAWYHDRMEFSVDSHVYHKHYFNDGAAFGGGIQDGNDQSAVRTINGKRVMISEYSNHFSEWFPYEHTFYIILSAGVGGNDNVTYGGAITSDAQFPCTVLVDWVRVYKMI